MHPLEDRVKQTTQAADALKSDIDRQQVELRNGESQLEQQQKQLVVQVNSTKLEINRQQADLRNGEAQLEQQQKQLSLDVVATKTDIRQQQDSLNANQLQLTIRVDHQSSATGAKSGDLSAYERLRADSTNSDVRIAQSAKSALSEVEMYYDFDRSQLFYKIRVDPISKVDPGFSIDELILSLHTQILAEDRQAVANTLNNTIEQETPKRTFVMEELINEIKKETNLRTIARFTRVISMLSAHEFQPLDREAILAWWDSGGSNETKFHSPYKGLFEVIKTWSVPSGSSHNIVITQEMMKSQVDALTDVLKIDDRAIYTRCFKAYLLTNLDRLDEANKEFDQVQKQVVVISE